MPVLLETQVESKPQPTAQELITQYYDLTLTPQRGIVRAFNTVTRGSRIIKDLANETGFRPSELTLLVGGIGSIANLSKNEQEFRARTSSYEYRIPQTDKASAIKDIVLTAIDKAWEARWSRIGC